MSRPIDAPFELTVREARDQIERTYSMLEKIRRRRRSFEHGAQELAERLQKTRSLYSLCRTFGLLDHHRDAPFEDHLAAVYAPGSLKATRTRVLEAIDRDGPGWVASKLARDPQSFGPLRGVPGSREQTQAVLEAQKIGGDLEQLYTTRDPLQRNLLEGPLHLDSESLFVARSLPEAITTLESYVELNQRYLERDLFHEATAERRLAEAARAAGGSDFAHVQLGWDVGRETEVVLTRHPDAASAPPTRFARFQAQLGQIEHLQASLEIRRAELGELRIRESRLARSIRSDLAVITRKNELFEALRRDRILLGSQLAQAYERDSLPGTHRDLALHTRVHGREATARRLAEHPPKFGQLRGIAFSTTRRDAIEAARQAAAHLESFETHRVNLAALSTRRTFRHLQRSETELARIQGKLRLAPTRALEHDLVHAVNAVGGIRRLTSHLAPATLATIDQALRAVRALEGGRER